MEKLLFQNDVRIFYSPSCHLFSYDRVITVNSAQDYLENLFRNLKMTQVRFRKDKKSFVLLLPYYQRILHSRAFNWLIKELKALENWFLHWYIFDRNLFVYDILETYAKTGPKSLDGLPPTEKEVDLIFVIVLLSLIKGKLGNYLHVLDLNFKDEIKAISV